MQDVLSVPNEVAAELAGVGDGVLDSLRSRLECTLRLRGNQLTIEGDDDKVVAAAPAFTSTPDALAAKAGVTYENTSETEPLVVLRYFGPEMNPDAPPLKYKGDVKL